MACRGLQVHSLCILAVILLLFEKPQRGDAGSQRPHPQHPQHMCNKVMPMFPTLLHMLHLLHLLLNISERGLWVLLKLHRYTATSATSATGRQKPLPDLPPIRICLGPCQPNCRMQSASRLCMPLCCPLARMPSLSVMSSCENTRTSAPIRSPSTPAKTSSHGSISRRCSCSSPALAQRNGGSTIDASFASIIAASANS